MAGCDQCGRCCKLEGMAIHATPEDVRRWKARGFLEIFDHIHPKTLELWVDAGTLKKLDGCPYLLEACSLQNKRAMYFCAIQDMKPSKCASYVCLRKELGESFANL